jgi:hypothetical protein
MAEIEQFSALVADIHDASLGPSLWPGVLEKICAFVPAAVSNIFVHDGVAKHVHAGFDYGLGARSSELYLTKYARLNPMFPALVLRSRRNFLQFQSRPGGANGADPVLPGISQAPRLG